MTSTISNKGYSKERHCWTTLHHELKFSKNHYLTIINNKVENVKILIIWVTRVSWLDMECLFYKIISFYQSRKFGPYFYWKALRLDLKAPYRTAWQYMFLCRAIKEMLGKNLTQYMKHIFCRWIAKKFLQVLLKSLLFEKNYSCFVYFINVHSSSIKTLSKSLQPGNGLMCFSIFPFFLALFFFTLKFYNNFPLESYIFCF